MTVLGQVVPGQLAFGGNTTQVDQFGFPMTSHLRQASSGYDSTVGITLTQARSWPVHRRGEHGVHGVQAAGEQSPDHRATLVQHLPGRRGTGRIPPGPFTLDKPTSADVFACAGALASGSDTEKQLGAEFCAAFNLPSPTTM